MCLFGGFFFLKKLIRFYIWTFTNKGGSQQNNCLSTHEIIEGWREAVKPILQCIAAVWEAAEIWY